MIYFIIGVIVLLLAKRFIDKEIVPAAVDMYPIFSPLFLTRLFYFIVGIFWPVALWIFAKYWISDAHWWCKDRIFLLRAYLRLLRYRRHLKSKAA
ncbi:MAG: hypothetical protein EOP56_09240 [Sphingobacteriales bacterium]|nr:MAG: hypothetical protein EOP56_09240 [Sphingobacteriales bacterium]